MMIIDNLNITVYGTPQSLKRHRHKTVGKFVKTYDPSADDKENFLYKAIADKKPTSPTEEALILNVNFYMPRPKSHYGSGKNEKLLKPTAPKLHTKKPDLDNLLKFVKDAFNGVYYKDDSQIYKINALKLYTNMTPRTEIEIEIVNNK